jgi:Na+/proline symporter
VGGLGGLFLAAIWVKRCTGPIVVQATCAGMLFGLVVGWGHTFGVFPPDRPLSFMWIIPSSCLVTLLYAYLAGGLRSRGDR